MSEEDLNDQLVETSALDENRYIAQRRDKLSELREQGQAYPNDFRRTDVAGNLQQAYGSFDKPALEEKAVQASVAGRMMLKRDKGKVVFADLQDMSGKIQVFVRKDSVG